MKKIMLSVVLLLSFFSLQAQKTLNIQMLEQFYKNYFSSHRTGGDFTRLDSLVQSNCTPEFVQAWNEDVKDIGLYDPLTNGFCEDFDTMKNSLSIRKEDDHYIVSFCYYTWPDKKKETESVIVYVNNKGKISHTKRPSDGYMTPAL